MIFDEEISRLEGGYERRGLRDRSPSREGDCAERSDAVASATHHWTPDSLFKFRRDWIVNIRLVVLSHGVLVFSLYGLVGAEFAESVIPGRFVVQKA